MCRSARSAEEAKGVGAARDVVASADAGLEEAPLSASMAGVVGGVEADGLCGRRCLWSCWNRSGVLARPPARASVRSQSPAWALGQARRARRKRLRRGPPLEPPSAGASPSDSLRASVTLWIGLFCSSSLALAAATTLGMPQRATPRCRPPWFLACSCRTSGGRSPLLTIGIFCFASWLADPGGIPAGEGGASSIFFCVFCAWLARSRETPRAPRPATLRPFIKNCE